MIARGFALYSPSPARSGCCAWSRCSGPAVSRSSTRWTTTSSAPTSHPGQPAQRRWPPTGRRAELPTISCRFRRRLPAAPRGARRSAHTASVTRRASSAAPKRSNTEPAACRSGRGPPPTAGDPGAGIPRRQRRPCSRSCSVMRRGSTATGSSAGAAVTSLAEERFTPRWRFGGVQRRPRPQHRDHQCHDDEDPDEADYEPDGEPERHGGDQYEHQDGEHPPEHRGLGGIPAPPFHTLFSPAPSAPERGLSGCRGEPSAIHFNAPAPRRGSFAPWSARRSRAESRTWPIGQGSSVSRASE
jgi:hypothetical protein